VACTTFALYPHEGLADYKLVAGHFPWLDGLYLVDILTVVPPCVLSKALEIQFPLRANEADQTYPHIVACLGDLSADSFGLHFGANILSTLAFMFFLAQPIWLPAQTAAGVLLIVVW